MPTVSISRRPQHRVLTTLLGCSIRPSRTRTTRCGSHDPCEEPGLTLETIGRYTLSCLWIGVPLQASNGIREVVCGMAVPLWAGVELTRVKIQLFCVQRNPATQGRSAAPGCVLPNNDNWREVFVLLALRPPRADSASRLLETQNAARACASPASASTTAASALPFCPSREADGGDSVGGFLSTDSRNSANHARRCSSNNDSDRLRASVTDLVASAAEASAAFTSR